MRGVLIILLVVAAIFWQTWFKGLFPYPGNFMLAWYEPWKTQYFRGGTITIAHKPVIDDAFRLLVPLRGLAVDLIKSGAWPLINPYNGAGAPLLAVMHPGFLNPFGVLFFFLPLPWAWTLFIGLQLVLLGWGFYLYCRKIGQSHWAALMASVILLFSGYVTVRLEYGEFLYGLASLPFLLYLIENWIQNSSSRRILLLPLVVAFLFVSGQPHLIVYVLGVAGVYSLWRFLGSGFKKPALRLGLLLILVFLGAGLAAVQLVPSLELFANSTIISQSRALFDKFYVPFSHLITMLIPNYFGNHATYNYFGAAGDSIETAAGLGLTAVFLASLSWLNRKPRGYVIFFWGLALVATATTLNWWGARLVKFLPLPVLAAEVHSRVFVLTTFGLAVTSGFGLDLLLRLKRFDRDLKKLFVGFAGLALLILVGTSVIYLRKMPCLNVYVPDCRSVSLRNTLLAETFFSLNFALLAFALFKPQFKKLAIAGVFSFLVISGLYDSYKFLPFSSQTTFLPPTEVFTALAKFTRDSRVLGVGEAYFKANFATAYRIYDPNYYDPLHMRRYAELVHYANNGTLKGNLERSDILIIRDALVDPEIALRRQRLWDLLSVGYLLYKQDEVPVFLKPVWQEGPWVLIKNTSVLPRAYLVGNYQVIRQASMLLSRLFAADFNPQREVLLEEDPGLTLAADTKGTVEVASYKEQNVLLKVNAASPTLLVLTDASYPGWKATVDDRATRIYRANYALRAVVVPAGEHEVRYIYDPLSLKLGIGISIASAVLLLILVAICLQKQKRRKVTS